MTSMGAKVDKKYHSMLTDTPELRADSIVWLTGERRGWLAGRYLSCTWDMSEVLEKQQQVIDGDLLKVRLAVE